MDTLGYPIFNVISGLIRKDFFNQMDNAYLRMVDSVVIIALLIETFFIIRAGYIIMGNKTTEDEKNPDLQELTYHALVVCGALFWLKESTIETGPLSFIIALKSMMIAGLTGKDDSGGHVVAQALSEMSNAFAVGNMVNSVDVSADAPAIKSTLISLSLVSQVAPQVTGGLLLLFNEMMVRIGMAIFPLVAYAALYKTTRDIFMTWLGLMAALAFLMAAAAVTTVLAAEVTVRFVAGFAGIVALHQAGVGDYVISELQQSLIQSGFGFTITLVMLNFPVNVANFAGDYLQFAGPTTNNELGALYKNDRKMARR
jgi:hypothetical protein